MSRTKKRIFISQHIGDMENLATLDAFDATVDLFSTMYDICPDVVAVTVDAVCDSGQKVRASSASTPATAT